MPSTTGRARRRVGTATGQREATADGPPNAKYTDKFPNEPRAIEQSGGLGRSD